MPSFDVTAPNGKTYEVTAPEGASHEQVLAYVQQHHEASAAPASPPRSFGQRVTDMYHGATQAPYDIVQSGIELGARGLDAVGVTDQAFPKTKQFFDQSNNDAAAIGGADPNSGFYKGGRIAGQVAATLPAMALRVPGLAANLPRLAPVVNGALQGATAAAATSNSSDKPLVDQLTLGAAGGAALPALGAGLRGAKSIGVNLLGATTGAGASSVRGAFDAGMAGGAKSEAFTSAMRDPSTWDKVVTDAKQAVAKLKGERGAAYRSGMQDISADRTVLDFQPVDDAMAKNASVKNFHGKDLEPDTADMRSKVNSTLQDWRGSDPATFHTPEGFDALKQKLGGFRDSEKYGTPAWKVANDAYSAVRNTIADQAPVYNKVMGDYSKASNSITELEKELSLGAKGNPNTALRKLQSVMRDNVNTSWGKRAQLAGSLEDAGAGNLMPSLSGQALSAALPRGLARYGDLATGLTVTGAGAAGGGLPGIMAALPLLAASSPRVVGESAHLLGSIVGGSRRAASKLPAPALPRLSLSPALGAALPQYAFQH